MKIPAGAIGSEGLERVSAEDRSMVIDERPETLPTRHDNGHALRLVLRTQSRSVRLWSAAVSSEDQPQRARTSQGK